MRLHEVMEEINVGKRYTVELFPNKELELELIDDFLNLELVIISSYDTTENGMLLKDCYTLDVIARANYFEHRERSLQEVLLGSNLGKRYRMTLGKVIDTEVEIFSYDSTPTLFIVGEDKRVTDVYDLIDIVHAKYVEVG